MEEQWLPVKGYEGLYQVSSLGRIKCADRVCGAKGGSTQLRKGKVMSPGVDSCGYLQVGLLDLKGEKRRFMLHRIIAETFIPNPYNLPEVNHKNWNRKECAVWNLEWMTRDENIEHAQIKKKLESLYKESEPVKRTPVSMLDENKNVLKDFTSMAEAFAFLGKAHTVNIGKAIKNNHRAYGYYWRHT